MTNRPEQLPPTPNLNHHVTRLTFRSRCFTILPVHNYQFEDTLNKRAEEFVRVLQADGIDASIVPDSVREYSIKVSIASEGSDVGTVVIYYSPKSDSFSMTTNELREPSITTTLERLWKEKPTVSKRSSLRCEAYVDGSYINGATGYGAVILQNRKVVEELSGRVAASEVNGSRQVAGELAAVKAALNWCMAHSVAKVEIYYDYLGIEKWARGQWKTNQPLTRGYARFVAECPVKIIWHKVASHTGDRWNDRADLLAKQGAGLLPNSPERLLSPDAQASLRPAISSTIPDAINSATANVQPDLVSDVIKKVNKWIEFLMVRGIEATFDRIYNDQFARVYIVRNDKPVGTFDLYNTLKKRFSPYIHNFRDEDLKARIETLWREFLVS